MFSWSKDASIEVDVPLEKFWELCINPSHWIYQERFESCKLEGEFAVGSKILLKLKNKSISLTWVIKEYEKNKYYKVRFSRLLATQENTLFIRESENGKTVITIKIETLGFLAPFVHLMKKSTEKLLRDYTDLFVNNIVQVYNDRKRITDRMNDAY